MYEWIKLNFPSHKDKVTALSELLTALAFVASAAVFILQSYWSKQVELNAVLVNSTPSVVSVLITNSGGVDVAIKRILVRSTGVRDVDILDMGTGGKLLEKGKSTLEPFDKKLMLGMAVQKDYLVTPDQQNDLSVGTTDCSIRIEMIDADGKNHSREIKYKCVAGCFYAPKPTHK